MLKWSEAFFRQQAIPILMVTVSFLISVVGILLSVFSVSYLLTNGTTVTGVLLTLLTLALGLLIVTGSGWVLIEDFTLEEMFRIGNWAFGGIILFELIFLLIHYYQQESGQATANVELTAPAILSAGIVMGFMTGVRSIQREKSARNARDRLEQVEFLNSILRHEILNSHTVIQGYADYLLEEDDIQDSGELETIARRSQSVTDRVASIRSLIELINDDDANKEPIDLVGTLEREVEIQRTSNPAADISFDAEPLEECKVEANELLGSLFENLIGNAIEHDPSDQPTVTVSVETAEDIASVTIADSGVGLREDLASALTEEDGDRSVLLDAGFGLYIVRKIVDQLNGDIHVENRVSGGVAITVELPRVDG